MEDWSFQAWTNTETRDVAICIAEEPCYVDRWKDSAFRVWRSAASSSLVRRWGWQRRKTARAILAEKLRQEYRDGSPLIAARMFSDVMRTAMSEVNWSEIAERLITQAANAEQSARQLREICNKSKA